MSKKLLIDEIAPKFDSAAQAERAINHVLGGITALARKGHRVSLVNFGSFVVKRRAERMGRNPATNEPVKIGARDVLTFKPSDKL